MAVKSIIEIELNDEEFKAFQSVFNKYQTQLKNMPKEWASAASGAAAVKSEFVETTEESRKQNELAKSQEEHLRSSRSLINSSTLSWSTLYKGTKDVASSIGDATKSLIKWSTLSTAFTGLLGAGSLFGIDRLAVNVAMQRRSAMGLGITYGQQAAMGISYNRLIDSGSLLEHVANAKYDITSPEYKALLMSGVSPQKIQKGNAADISVDFLHRLPELFKGWEKNPSMVGPRAQALGIDKLLSNEDFMRYLNASPDERSNIEKKYASSDYNLSNQTQEKWQNLVNQLDKASETIKVSFLEKFSRVVPAIEKISGSFTHAVEAFAKSDILKTWIDDLGTGLDGLANYIDKPEFQTGVKNLVEGIKDVAKSVWDFIASFGPEITPNEPSIAARQGISRAAAIITPSAGITPKTAPSVPQETPTKGKQSWWTPERMKYIADRLVNEAGLTEMGAAGLVARMAYVESTGPSDINKQSGAMGIAQWLGKRKKGVILGDLKSQTDHVIDEIKNSEKSAAEVLRHARTKEEAARGASMYERAEGYNPSTGYDYFTNKTPVGKVYDTIYGNSSFSGAASKPTVSIWQNTGNNPNLSTYQTDQTYTKPGPP